MPMTFTETRLAGAFLVTPELIEDERGFFTRAFCHDEFKRRGLEPNVAQCNISFSRARGTLRGMHYQIAPHQEVKLVRCTMGAVFDVIIDLRADSRSYLNWFGIELTADNRVMVYVPRGLAHGYITLRDSSEVCYQVSEFYAKGGERGVRWNDPAFGIEWPIEPQVISERDRSHFPYLG
jgi:dTDP-4-dehydrorhamnose 3,5-epimerase